MDLKTIFVMILVTVGAITSGQYIAEEISYQIAKGQDKYNSENKCIADKVALGIERSSIARDDGSCYVKN